MAAKPIFEDVPSWPEANPRAVTGGNKPPLEELIPAEFRAELLAARPDFLTKVDDLVGAADRARADDDDTLGRCGDLIKGYRAAAAHIDAAHKAVKQPYLDGGRLVDGEKNVLAGRIATARAKVEGVANAFMAKREAAARAERDRIAAEQRAAADAAASAERARRDAEADAARAFASAASAAERAAAAARAAEARALAEETAAAAALAPAAPTKTDPVRSDAGAVISGKTEWASEVLDYAKAFKFVKNDPKVREAIDAAVARLTKQTKGALDMAPAVRTWPVTKGNFH